MSNILWLSNSISAPTGYGNQSAVFLKRLKKDGFGVANIAFWGIQGSPRRSVFSDGSDSILELPITGHPYGQDVVQSYYKQLGADCVINLLDAFVCEPSAYQGLLTAHWAPIDSTPLSYPNFHFLSTVDRVWAMSKFGEEVLTAAGLMNVDYVPHGVESDVFTPVSRDDALALVKRETNIDLSNETFYVMNAANKGNPSRKNFWEAILSLASLPEHIKLFINTSVVGYGGVDIMGMAQLAGVVDRIIIPPQFMYDTGQLSQAYLNGVYNLAKFLVIPSKGEGFGIPIIEAQMAGCPVVGTNFSAIPELIKTGIHVDCLPEISPIPVLQAKPIQEKLNEACALMFQNNFAKGEVRSRVIEYDADTVYEKWMRPAVERLLNVRRNYDARANKRSHYNDA